MRIVTLVVVLFLFVNGGFLAAQIQETKEFLTADPPVIEVPKSAMQFQGRYIITPDDSGMLNFDSSLAVRLQSALEAARTTGSLKGALAALMIPGKGIWQGSVGISSENPIDSLKPDMLFSIASNTKTFTAALVLKLCEEGKLSLEDTIGTWIKGYPTIAGSITIRQLLNMTSGLFDFINDTAAYFQTVNKDFTKLWAPESVLTAFMGPPKLPPGLPYRYTNTGPFIAGMIIQKITGKSIADYLLETILQPLKLSQTFFTPEDSFSLPIAHGWTNWFSPNYSVMEDYSLNSLNSNMSSLFTAGAIYSTTENMARWVHRFYSGEFLSASSMDNVYTIVPLSHDLRYRFTRSGYGLATFRNHFYNELMWGHSGSWPGYFSLGLYIPETGVVIVICVNEQNVFRTYRPDVLVLEGIGKTYFQSIKPYYNINTQTMSLSTKSNKQFWDTTVFVKNFGGGLDSLLVSVLPSISEPESTFLIQPASFTLLPGDSQVVTFRINTTQWTIKKIHTGKLIVDAKYAFDRKRWEIPYQIAHDIVSVAGTQTSIPQEYSLSQNYPNPFNPSTQILFTLRASGFTSLKVYDLLGREVATLVNEQKPPGVYDISWNANNVAAGVYFYQLRTDGFVQTKKLILQK